MRLRGMFWVWVAVLLCTGCKPDAWWYPFPIAVSPAVYGTGPLPMTSNVREDNPEIWRGMAQLNQMQARTSYAMTRGVPDAQIAWLFPRAEWPDKAALRFFSFEPNGNEGALSKALAEAGYVYDRISRKNLREAKALRTEGAPRFAVGAATYKALLIDGWRAADPDMLASVLRLAEAGIPVVVLEGLPERAYGWSNHESRDAQIKRIRSKLAPLVRGAASATEIGAILRSADVLPSLATTDGTALPLRMDRRRIASGHILLLFNERQSPVHTKLRVQVPFQSIDSLNTETGEIQRLEGEGRELNMSVPGHRIRLLLIRDGSESTDSVYGNGWDPDLWLNPPRNFYPFIRWWWPGNAVEDNELRAELRSIYAANFGGVELQTLTIGFPFSELENDHRGIYGVGTPSYLHHVQTVLDEAEQLGITVDLTFGSGWPGGGPFITDHSEQQLLCATKDVEGPARFSESVPRPGEPSYVRLTNFIIARTIGPFDDHLRLQQVVAARLNTKTSPATLSEMTDITSHVSGGTLQWNVPEGKYRIFAFFQNATSHNVAASAFPGALIAAPTLDHLDPGGVQEQILKMGNPWLAELAPYKPNAFFVDSFELIGELPWSDMFRRAFLEMHGYDIAPVLPLVLRSHGESKYSNMIRRIGPAYRTHGEQAKRVREDYLATREQLFLKSFVEPLQRWTASKGIAVRLQAHGGYGDYLDTYQLADIPESEGLFAGGTFDFLKLASSAAHVAGKPIVSSESYINLALNWNALKLEDYYLLSGNAFAAGINRLVAHGYAYHLPYHEEGAKRPSASW